MCVALLVVMVHVRYPTKQCPPSGVRMNGMSFPIGIQLTTPSPVQADMYMTVAEESDPEPMEGMRPVWVLELL